MNVRALAGIGLAASFALTACGSSSPSTLTKEQWIAQANAICADLNARTSAADPKSEAEVGPAITAISQIVTEDVGKLAALKPPSEIQTDVAALLAAYDSGEKLLQSAAAKVASGDVAGASAEASQGADAGKAADPIATRLGATECAKES